MLDHWTGGEGFDVSGGDGGFHFEIVGGEGIGRTEPDGLGVAMFIAADCLANVSMPGFWNVEEGSGLRSVVEGASCRQLGTGLGLKFEVLSRFEFAPDILLVTELSTLDWEDCSIGVGFTSSVRELGDCCKALVRGSILWGKLVLVFGDDFAIDHEVELGAFFDPLLVLDLDSEGTEYAVCFELVADTVPD